MKKIFLFFIFMAVVTGCHPDGEKAKSEVALETSFILDGTPTEVHWGRKNTDRGFSYDKVPISVCIYFLSSIPELASRRNASVDVYSGGEILDPKSKFYGEEVAQACSLSPQQIEIVKTS